jgi:hypothetical protein
MYRFARHALLLSFCTLFAGCAQMGGGGGSDSSSNSKLTTQAPTDTELAAYASRHNFPTTQPGDDLRVAALISHDRATLRLYNFSNEPLADVNVWVNHAWLQHVSGIGANGSVTIKTIDLYNAFGKNFSSQAEPVSRVQLEIGNRFYNAMGPVTE